MLASSPLSGSSTVANALSVTPAFPITNAQNPSLLPVRVVSSEYQWFPAIAAVANNFAGNVIRSCTVGVNFAFTKDNKLI